jgi:hypothetical protein
MILFNDELDLHELDLLPKLIIMEDGRIGE